MTNIHNDNNINFGKLNSMQSVAKESQPIAEVNSVAEESVAKECQNAENQVSVAGRSIAFKGADNFASDMNFLLKNPKLAADSVAFSELAEKSVPYETACGLAQAYAKEFKK